MQSIITFKTIYFIKMRYLNGLLSMTFYTNKKDFNKFLRIYKKGVHYSEFEHGVL